MDHEKEIMQYLIKTGMLLSLPKIEGPVVCPSCNSGDAELVKILTSCKIVCRSCDKTFSTEDICKLFFGERGPEKVTEKMRKDFGK